MKYLITCPCGCGCSFEFEVPKTRRNVSPEEREKRAERMRILGGKRAGMKDTKPRKPRSDRGVKRGSRSSVFELQEAEEATTREKFLTRCRNGEKDPAQCPYSKACGGKCDGVVMAEGFAQQCDNMQACYLEHEKYKEFPDG